MIDYFSLRLPDDDIRAISSIALAHLGDGVYELLVRSYLCAHGKATGKGLHRAAVSLVCAPRQAAFADRILDQLTEEELAERDVLRQRYIASVRENLRAQLDSTYIVTPDGKKTKLLNKNTPPHKKS